MAQMTQKELVLQYLSEAHALETALVTNLGAHSGMTPNGTYKTLLERHRKTTQEHAEAVERRINELGEDCDRGFVAKAAELARDAVGQALVLTKGPIDMVRGTGANEKLLKNAKDEVTTEAQEIATYDALEAAAVAAGDEETAKLARAHRKDEEAMLEALRKEIPKLALADVKERTDGPVKTTTSRSSSGRSTSSSSKSSSSRSTATKKAGTAKRSTTRSTSSSSSSKSTGSKSGGSGSKSTTSRSRSTSSKSGSSKS
jgi:ferritin-like metal-binding protein YciE